MTWSIRPKSGRLYSVRKLAHAIYKDLFSDVKIDNFTKKKRNKKKEKHTLCGGGSNEYRQSVFWIKNKKNNCILVNPSFII